tara:strand:+ start:587 stop:1474 length:888 start_codon:yes stop_codon:yes gene_type:complete
VDDKTMLNINVENSLKEIKRNGFCIIEGAISDLDISDLQSKFTNLFTREKTSGNQLGSTWNEDGESVWVDHPFAVDRKLLHISTDKNLVRLISEYLSCKIQMSYAFAYRLFPVASVNNKNQHKIYTPGVFKGWHSDANLTAESRGYRCLVAMIYLSDVSPGDGGVTIVRGSHLYGGKKRAWDQAEFPQEDIVEVCGPRGSLIIFDMEMIHRAGTPQGEKPRDIIRFMYSPIGSYATDYLIPLSFFDGDLDEESIEILGCNKFKNDGISFSPLHDKDNSKLNKRILLRKFLSRIVG